jgi:copper chaperone CopZ
MEFNATIDLIIKDLDEARAIIDALKRYPGVPEIQVELAKAKCRSAADIIALLKKIKSETSFNEEKTSEVVEEKKSFFTEVIDHVIVHESKKNEEVTEELFIPEIENPPPSIEEFSNLTKKSAESAILADTFRLSNRMNEKLGHLNEDEDFTDLLKSRHLTNLREAIGVNDKFLFIKEIFKNDRDAYNLAMSRLEQATNIEDAKAIIMSYTGDDRITGAVKQLLDIVKRKLHQNE